MTNIRHLVTMTTLMTALPLLQAKADVFTALSLYSMCFLAPAAGLSEQDQNAADLTCKAYIRGFTQGMFMMQAFVEHSRKPCTPSDGSVTAEDALKLFHEYFSAHPQSTANSAGLVVGMALADAYKCR